MNPRSILQVEQPTVTMGSQAIRFLWNQITDSVAAFSPSLVKQIIESGMEFTLKLDDLHQFRVGSNSSGAIFLSKKFLATLWASSYLNVTYWIIRCEAGPMGKKVEIDPADHPDLLAAMILFRKAVNGRLLDETTGEWPDYLPQPVANSARGSREFTTDEIMLRALGFILLHELFHCILSHEAKAPSEVSIQQEKDADREATVGFIEGADPASGGFILRCFGIVTALFFAAIPDLFERKDPNKQEEEPKHPPAWMRMDQIFQVIGLPNGHPGLEFASELKSLYVGLAGAQTGGRFETPAASMEHYFEAASGIIVPDVGQSPPQLSTVSLPPGYHNEMLLLLLNRHRQKYEKSCSPSLIEIMLKYYRLVPWGYYKLQDRYENENVGLTVFAGQTIEGLRIESHDPSSGVSFVERLVQEVEDGRLVGIYCHNPPEYGTGCHGWVVSSILGDTVIMLSKASEAGGGEGQTTLVGRQLLVGCDALVITDLIVGFPQIDV